MSTANALFSGPERRKRQMNLGGASASLSHASLLDQAKAERAQREAARRREASAVKIQAWWRGRAEAQRVKEYMARLFDEQMSRESDSVVAMRCLVLMGSGRNQERLDAWSQAMALGGETRILRPAAGPQPLSWLVVVRQLALILLQCVAQDPHSNAAVFHLTVLETLLSSAAAARVVPAGGRALVEEITSYLLRHGMYALLSMATLNIAVDKKAHPCLPLLASIYTAPTSTFPKESNAFCLSLQSLIQHILTIPLLLYRLPLPSVTRLSATLPLSSLQTISPTITPLVESIPLHAKPHLLANLSAFVSPRVTKLPALALETYLHLTTQIFNAIPPNSLEPPQQHHAALQASWPDDDEVDNVGPQSTSISGASLSSRQLDLDQRTRSRLQSITDQGQILSLLTATSKQPSSRSIMLCYFLSLCAAWPLRKEKILSIIIAHTGGGVMRELYRGFVRGSSLGKSDDFKVLTASEQASSWPALLFLTDLYTQALLTMGDDEFFGSNSQSTVNVARNPLTLDELIAFSSQLLTIAFTLYWYGDQKDVEEGAVPGVARLSWASVRDKVTKCLQAIHARDSRRKFTPPDHWLCTSQLDMASFIDAAVYEEQSLANRMESSVSPRPLNRGQIAFLSPRLGVLNNIPFAIPFETRVRIFRHFVYNDMQKIGGDDMFMRGVRGGRTVAVIRRGHIAADGFDKLSNANLKGTVQIIFIDEFGQEEAGIDGGGVFKEFFTSLCKEAFDTNRGLWLATKQNELYPNPHAYAKESHSLQWYRFVGRMLGKALYEGILIDVAFAGFFLAKWLGKQSFLDDLSSLDPELYQGLIFLKHYSGNPEDLSLNFTVTDEDFGVARTIDLITDGSNVPVTRENRLQYIYLVCHYRLTKQIRLQSEAFFEGLSEMIDPKWLKMFNQQELQVLIGGVNSPIDLDDLRRNTNYGGLYDDQEMTIQSFWKVVNSFDQEQRRALLRFATSCSRPPLLGFKELSPKFSIRDAGNDEERLPTASTCVNLLKLPRYRSERRLREKLLQAIFSGAGFDLS